ncbi:hypothetical protein [Marinobacterium sp. BA1]|uniref:hypothetical protein n=1 Tax=Marinobacterium sp. BA1 TaxID=3138931 RepID=UPI0032E7A413
MYSINEEGIRVFLEFHLAPLEVEGEEGESLTLMSHGDDPMPVEVPGEYEQKLRAVQVDSSCFIEVESQRGERMRLMEFRGVQKDFFPDGTDHLYLVAENGLLRCPLEFR